VRIIKSNKLADIINVNQRSVDAKTDICIIELSSLGDLIPSSEAEAMRQGWLDRNVRVKQLTNITVFEPWTAVDDFIESVMCVRYVPGSVLPIHAEMLVFDDVVAFYRVNPEVSVLVIEDADFADQQRALFGAVWEGAEPVMLQPDGSTA